MHILVRGKRADDMMGYAPLSVRVFKGEQQLADFPLTDLTAYPCSIVLDDLDGKPGNEIAVGWASVAGGYTAGVTVISSQ